MKISSEIESEKAIELLDVFHEFRRVKRNTRHGIETRDKFLTCLKSFKKISKSEEIVNISKVVKRNLERFEPLAQPNLVFEMRVFCRKYKYYDGFEPAGKCRRSQPPVEFA